MWRLRGMFLYMAGYMRWDIRSIFQAKMSLLQTDSIMMSQMSRHLRDGKVTHWCIHAQPDRCKAQSEFTFRWRFGSWIIVVKFMIAGKDIKSIIRPSKTAKKNKQQAEKASQSTPNRPMPPLPCSMEIFSLPNAPAMINHAPLSMHNPSCWSFTRPFRPPNYVLLYVRALKPSLF